MLIRRKRIKPKGAPSAASRNVEQLKITKKKEREKERGRLNNLDSDMEYGFEGERIQ